MELHLDAMIPKEHIQEFIQLVRTFDKTHPNCHFDMTTNDDTMSLEEVRAIFDKINPPFPEMRVWKKGNA